MKGLIISATVLVVSLLVFTLAIDPLHLQPEQIHLAFGNSVEEMVIMWSTSFLDGRSVSTVYYGEDPENLLNKTIGTFVYWSDGNELGLHYTHTVILRDLQPSTTYYYQCESSFKKSDVYSFTTLTPGNDWVPEFLIVGDMGRYETPQAIPSMIRRVQAGGPTAIIHVGDFAYDFDTFAGLEGDNFMNQIQPMAALVPYMTCVGNHENNYNYSHYINRFHMPGNNSNMWFSWNVAGAHFIAYSTETLFYPTEDWKTEDQIAWLDKDLEEANKHRDEQPWIIAYGHRPFYCSNTDHDDCTHPKKGIVREAFEKLFFKHGVDIVLEAHEHSYERLWPVYDSIVTQKNYTNPWAPIHLITGVGGCNEDDGHCINPIKRSHGPWSAFRASGERKYGYGLLRVHNASHVYFEEILAVENDNVLDSVWIVQENHGPRNLTE